MFKIEDREWKKTVDKMKRDMGETIVNRLRDDLEEVKSYYSENVSDQIEYFEDDQVIGSEEWPPLIINEGLAPGTFPNLDKIDDWVRNRKDGGKYKEASDSTVRKISLKVARKIEREGIQPSWYVDHTLSKIEGENA